MPKLHGYIRIEKDGTIEMEDIRDVEFANDLWTFAAEKLDLPTSFTGAEVTKSGKVVLRA